MFRLLYAELYKLKKSKSFYTCMLVMAAFVLLMYTMFALVNSVNTASASVSMPEEIGFMEMLRQIFAGDLVACVLAVYISVFTISEYGSGMVKNIVGKGIPRISIFLSRLFTAILASVSITLIGILTTLLGSLLFIGTHIFADLRWQDFLIYTGIQLLLAASLTAVYVLICEISRNLAAGIAITISTATFPVLLFSGLDVICKDYAFTPSAFWMICRSESCPTTGFTSGYIAETALVSASWLIAAAILGIRHFSKSDIK